MSQPTTWGAPRIADAPVSPEDYAIRVDDSLDALLSSHSGTARPAYAAIGTVWHDTDDGLLYHYDGTNDLKLLIEDALGDVAIANDLTLTAGDLIATAGNVVVTAGDLVITAPTTPASAAATGVIGTIAWDTSYVYVCTATDTWKRAAIATW